ncbi:hypothetical protein O3P69_002376 [Scylla paramamosain]|uniref:Uncharacterized protein n=1 Tax=Scylla paramamosain TaxID=85552 RepID=A0AAW0V7P0_SCYPA
MSDFGDWDDCDGGCMECEDCQDCDCNYDFRKLLCCFMKSTKRGKVDRRKTEKGKEQADKQEEITSQP